MQGPEVAEFHGLGMPVIKGHEATTVVAIHTYTLHAAIAALPCVRRWVAFAWPAVHPNGVGQERCHVGLAFGIILIQPIPLAVVCVPDVGVLPGVEGVAAGNTLAVVDFWIIVPCAPSLDGGAPPSALVE